MKTIQKITAWRYPCDNLPFIFTGRFLDVEGRYAPCDTRIHLTGDFGKCFCGKNCKPQHIVITVKELL